MKLITIKKVLNSSVVFVQKDNQDMIALGKGIGFAKKAGMSIEETDVDQIFLPVENLQAKQIIDLVNGIPTIYFEITKEIYDLAEADVDTPFSPSIIFALTDHIHFAIERFEQGIEFHNKIFWEIQNYYPKEFHIGQKALEIIKDKLGYSLSYDEAANIALYIINAQNQTNKGDVVKQAKMIRSIVNLVRYNIHGDWNQESLQYKRFITHVKFFVERFYTNTISETSQTEKDFFEYIANMYPEAMNIAIKVSDYIERLEGRDINNDELTYLAVHINRLIKNTQEQKNEN